MRGGEEGPRHTPALVPAPPACPCPCPAPAPAPALRSSLHVIYRDLKPENVLLDHKGNRACGEGRKGERSPTSSGGCCSSSSSVQRASPPPSPPPAAAAAAVRLTDFGLSKENVAGVDSGASSFCGTPEYLAPEVLHRAGHGQGVDWWSLGALLYEMLTGLPPFYSRDRHQLFDRIKRAALEFPDYVSAEAADLLRGLLCRDPARRLGCGAGDAAEVKAHPFFGGVDWAALLDGRVPPPWVPPVASFADTQFFDAEFTSLPLISPSSAATTVVAGAGAAGGAAAAFLGGYGMAPSAAAAPSPAPVFAAAAAAAAFAAPPAAAATAAASAAAPVTTAAAAAAALQQQPSGGGAAGAGRVVAAVSSSGALFDGFTFVAPLPDGGLLRAGGAGAAPAGPASHAMACH